MTDLFTYDNGYATGVQFPIDIPGYGRITTPADWLEYLTVLEQEVDHKYNRDLGMKNLKIENFFASTNPPTTE